MGGGRDSSQKKTKNFMKKLLYTLAAVATVLAAAGCARELAPAEAAGDTVTATFTVSAPSAVATKAIADGTTATELVFAAYDESGNYLQALSEAATVNPSGSKKWTVSTQVVLGITYKFAFFAKSAEDKGFYTFAPAAKTITVDYDKLPANDDNADVFYAVTDAIEVSSANLSQSVTLKRPVAQVNVADPDADLTAASYSLGVANATSALKLTEINNVLDIFEGTVRGADEVEFEEAARPVDKITVSGTDYNRLAMVYVLAGATSQNTDVTFKVTAKGVSDGTDHAITREVANVPIQANYRTNILGNIFTGTMDFTVTVDPNFETPEINETLETDIPKANALFAAGQTSVTVDLAPADGDETTITLPATTEAVRLNLNITTDETITVQYADGAKPATVEIYAKDVAGLTADLTSTTVTVSAGSHIATGTFKTADNTLIIEATAKVDNLVVNAGSTKIYGEVSTITGDAAANAAFYIADLAQLQAFRDAVNGGKRFTGFTVKLEADIDLSSVANWTPIGVENYANNFCGEFDGQNHVISNLTVKDAKAAGFFGRLNRATVKNLTIDGLALTSNHYAGGIVAWAEQGGSNILIDNCTVKNGTVFSSPELDGSSYDNGDKVGGIVGYAWRGSYTNNTVENLTITAYRDLAGIAGYALGATVTGNTVKDVNIVQSLENGYKADIPTTVAAVVGRDGGDNTIENNTEENVTVTTVLKEGIIINSEGQYVILSKTGLETFRDLVNSSSDATGYKGKTFLLDTDIDLNNELWTPIGPNADASNKFSGTFDGQGHKISNLFVDQTDKAEYRAAGLFGALNGTVQNLTIDNATVKSISSGSATDNGTAVVAGSLYNRGHVKSVNVYNAVVEGNRYCGGISGYTYGSIEDCVVDGITIVCKPDNLTGSYDNGDKVGGIAGAQWNKETYAFTGNTVKNFSVTGYRDIGGLAGHIGGRADLFKNNKAIDGVVTASNENAYSGHACGENTKELVGRGITPDETNTFENVKIYTLVAEGVIKDDSGNYTVSGDTGVLAAALADITNDTQNANPVITVTEDTDISFGARKTYGNDNTETITIDGGGNVLNFKGTDTDWSSIGNKNGKLIIKNAVINKTEPGNGAWNNHALNLTGTVYAENVTFNNSVSVDGNAEFKNCKFVETGAYYTLLMKANASALVVEDCEFTATSNGRGIKVIDQYVAEADLVQCNITVSGSKFTTASKAAILVTNTAGAKIIWGEGNDISGVAKDTVNAVWNDEDRKDAWDLVEVTGCTKKQE